MLPGGEWVLFTVGTRGVSWNEAQIVTESTTTGERRVLIERGQGGRYLPSGHLIYVLDNVLLAVPFDVESREVMAGPVPLVEGVDQQRIAGSVQFDVSTTGSLVYIPGSAYSGTVSLTWVDREGREEGIPAPPRPYGHPRVSPDGTRVAVDIADGNNTDIWVWDLVRETPTQLTFDEADDFFPLWTPDGAHVVFRSSREEGGVFRKAADGTGQVERLKPGAANPYAWTADGRLIFEAGADIGVLSLEGEGAEDILLDEEVSLFGPALSQDGRWLAYHAGAQSVILVRSFPNIDDGRWRVPSDLGRRPVWSPDGRELFFIGEADLMVAQVETEPTFNALVAEPLFSLRDYEIGDGRQYDLAPNGDRFIFRKRAASASDDARFTGLIFVENWFRELTERVPIP